MLFLTNWSNGNSGAVDCTTKAWNGFNTELPSHDVWYLYSEGLAAKDWIWVSYYDIIDNDDVECPISFSFLEGKF